MLVWLRYILCHKIMINGLITATKIVQQKCNILSHLMLVNVSMIILKIML